MASRKHKIPLREYVGARVRLVRDVATKAGRAQAGTEMIVCYQPGRGLNLEMAKGCPTCGIRWRVNGVYPDCFVVVEWAGSRAVAPEES